MTRIEKYFNYRKEIENFSYAYDKTKSKLKDIKYFLEKINAISPNILSSIEKEKINNYLTITNDYLQNYALSLKNDLMTIDLSFLEKINNDIKNISFELESNIVDKNTNKIDYKWLENNNSYKEMMEIKTIIFEISELLKTIDLNVEKDKVINNQLLDYQFKTTGENLIANKKNLINVLYFFLLALIVVLVIISIVLVNLEIYSSKV